MGGPAADQTHTGETYTGSQRRKRGLTAAQRCMLGCLAGDPGCLEGLLGHANSARRARCHSALLPLDCQAAHRAAALGQLNVDGQAAGEGALPVGAPQVGQRGPAVCARGGHADGCDCPALAHSLQVMVHPWLSRLSQTADLGTVPTIVCTGVLTCLQRFLLADNNYRRQPGGQCWQTLCSCGCRQGSAAAAVLSSTQPPARHQRWQQVNCRPHAQPTCAHLCIHAEPCARPADFVNRHSNVLLGLARDLGHGHRDVARGNIADLQQGSQKCKKAAAATSNQVKQAAMHTGHTGRRHGDSRLCACHKR